MNPRPWLYSLLEVHAAEPEVDGPHTDTFLSNGTVVPYSLDLGSAGILPELIDAHMMLAIAGVADTLGGAQDFRVFVDGFELHGALDGIDQRTSGEPDLDGYAFGEEISLFLPEFLTLAQIDAAMGDGVLTLELHVNGASAGVSVDWIYAAIADGGSESLDIGSSYCQANPNSTGQPAYITALGSTSLGDNDLTLRAEPVPNELFRFLFGPKAIQVPFGGGYLCVRNGIRPDLVPVPGEVAAGNLALSEFDLTGAGIVGGTQNFQCWYRDSAAGGSGFNTSDGIAILFVP